MPAGHAVASRIVTATMHEQFAALSGDRNPMHMDATAARRTPAGLQVVHGVHTLLWALESLFVSDQIVSPLARIRAKFLKWVYLGDEAVLRFFAADGAADPAQVIVEVRGLPVCSIDLTYGDPSQAGSGMGLTASPSVPRSSALDISFDQLVGLTGDAFTAQPMDAEQSFSHLAAKIGAVAVAEIAACSYIVGMEAPGLHSMFSKIDVTLLETAAKSVTMDRSALHYEVTYTDERFSKARIAVSGAGIVGTLEVFMRDPPVKQASMEALASRVTPGEFAGMRALIVGGSRGLGELTAKLIAAGGGEPIITYVLGKTDAERITDDIHHAGGLASTMPYNVRHEPAGQLSALSAVPTHLFYFATGTIYKPKPGIFSGETLAEFMQYYVQGFYDLCIALLENSQTNGAGRTKLFAFYPSTIFLQERPTGMTEYAMAKAAGEQLCVDMNAYMPEIQIMAPRLPKLYTDQTAGILPEGEIDTVEVLLPFIKELMHSAQAY